MSTVPTTLIDPLSGSSLRLELVALGNIVGTATGFVVARGGRHFLITNWHVVSGRHPETRQPLLGNGAVPDQIRIYHHATKGLGVWILATDALLDGNGDPLWIEHPRGSRVDVVALPIQEEPDIAFYPLDLALAETDMIPRPAMPVSIIGYPFGLAAGAGAGFPIWKTGHIASDPDLDYDGKPTFLIDATTRGGMSGSPVVLRLTGGYPTRNGGMVLAGGMATKFLGVYAGRIHDDVEIGYVWRPVVVAEILEAAG